MSASKQLREDNAALSTQHSALALRVLMVTAHYFPHLGGVETHTYEVARRLARRGVVTSVLAINASGQLPAVETLGSVSRICSDKTGTLTLMEMMVVSAVTADTTYKVSGNGYAPEGEVTHDGKPAGKDPVLDLLGRVSMLCNDAELFQRDGAWTVEGDPTEGALYPFATKLGMDRQAEQAAWPRTNAIPFESEHRFMATLHHHHDGTSVIYLKGAPERIIALCSSERVGHVDGPMRREFWSASVEA